jgi:hypothetical protein
MAKIILEVRTRGLSQYHRLEHFPATVGRALDNDIILSDPAISPHHMQISQTEDGSLMVQNLSQENGTLLEGHKLEEEAVALPVPSHLMLGGRKLNLLSDEIPVTPTNLLKFSGLFCFASKPLWAIILFVLCSLALFTEKYTATFVSKGAWFYLNDVLINLGILSSFALVLSLVTWVASHRWSLVPALSITFLLSLLKSVLVVLGGVLAYFFTSDSPDGWLSTLYNTVLVTGILYLYQRWASYLRPMPALAIAILLASPLIIIEALGQLERITQDGEFSGEPSYNQTLSAFNIHAGGTLSLDDYMQKATEALPSQLEEDGE